MSIFRRRIWQERISTLFLYYKSPKFALIDLTFGLIALFINPYRVCRKFLQRKGEKNIYAYGETPYSSYQKIAEECGIGPNDTIFELGSGRGKGCFWLNHFTGCKVIGVEWVPTFIFFARMIKAIFRVKGVHFIKDEITAIDPTEATVIYLYGLYPALKIAEGVKIITTGEPLEGYRIVKQFWIRFPWGRTTAFLQERVILDEEFSYGKFSSGN